MSGESLEASACCTRSTLLVFQVADQTYAVSSGDVAEILPMAELQCPPGAPKLLAGFLNLAGALVPVIRLHHLFGLPDRPTQLWTPLVIVRVFGKRLGLLVDSVNRTVAVSEQDVLPMPAHHVTSECAVGIVRSTDGAVTLLSPERLLVHQEKRALIELQQTAQRRADELKGIAE